MLEVPVSWDLFLSVHAGSRSFLGLLPFCSCWKSQFLGTSSFLFMLEVPVSWACLSPILDVFAGISAHEPMGVSGFVNIKNAPYFVGTFFLYGNQRNILVQTGHIFRMLNNHHY